MTKRTVADWIAIFMITLILLWLIALGFFTSCRSYTRGEIQETIPPHGTPAPDHL